MLLNLKFDQNQYIKSFETIMLDICAYGDSTFSYKSLLPILF